MKRKALSLRPFAAPVIASSFALVVAGVLSACGAAGETIDNHPCPSGGTTLTYENFGKAFLDGWCQRCHGSNADTRDGAPGSYVFDTRDQAYKWRARIFARAADDNDSMPVGPHGPPSEDRHKLGDWLACGAPP